MVMVRGALFASLLVSSTACQGGGGAGPDLDGTWLADLHIDTRSDTGDVYQSEMPGYELVVDQIGPAVLYAGVLGYLSGDRIAFGSEKKGSLSEDGDWMHGWWRVRTDGWAEHGAAEISMRVEVWDSAGTEIVGLNQDFRFDNFVRLSEPKRPLLEPTD